jgi:hypothetical protein
VRPFNGRTDIGLGIFGGFTAFLGLAASAQTSLAQLHKTVRRAPGQGLCIGVGADEFHTLYLALDHVLDGITAATTHPDHFDLCALVEFFCLDHFDGHGTSPKGFAVA